VCVKQLIKNSQLFVKKMKKVTFFDSHCILEGSINDNDVSLFVCPFVLLECETSLDQAI